MSKRGKNLRYTLPRFSPSGYHALMVSFRNLSGFEENDVAKFRLMVVDPRLAAFIKSMRETYGPVSKYKLKPLISRLKKAPKQTGPGYIEMDSITLYVNSKKYYFVTAIDIVTKFAWVMLTTSLSSRSAKQALVEFMAKYPYSIRDVQTDNGHEFWGEFDDYLQAQNIPHQFIYFHSPRINGVVAGNYLDIWNGIIPKGRITR